MDTILTAKFERKRCRRPFNRKSEVEVVRVVTRFVTEPEAVATGSYSQPAIHSSVDRWPADGVEFWIRSLPLPVLYPRPENALHLIVRLACSISSGGGLRH